MTSRGLASSTSRIVLTASLLGLLATGCNKQPSAPAVEAPTVAPPIAALPLATAAVPPAALAPLANALPPPARPVRYAPQAGRERYRYVDRAYSMGRALGDTPPDYSVDYEGTRPWIWRSGDGAYRVVEQLPQGEREYYYDPGEDQPFLVRDPDYSYGYDRGELVAVYGPDGAELEDEAAWRRADYASRYFERGRALRRAAQYERRQSAYAQEWARRQYDLRDDDRRWEEQQARNEDWRAWHEEHQAEQERQWRRERDQRAAYAAAIGIGAAMAAGRLSDRQGQPSTQDMSRASRPDPAELARRQAAYFSNWNASGGRARAAQALPSATAPVRSGAAMGGNVAPAQQAGREPQRERAAPEDRVGRIAQQRAAEAQSRNDALAKAQAAEATRAQQVAMDRQRRDAAAAQAKAAQAARADQAAAAQRQAIEARQREAAAKQAQTAEAARARQAAAATQRQEAAATKAQAAEAARAQQVAAAAQRQEAAAKAKAAQVERQQAALAQQRDAAARAKAAEAARAQHVAEAAQQQEAAAKAKAARAEQQQAALAQQRDAAAARAQAVEAARAQHAAAEAQRHEAGTKPKTAPAERPKRTAPPPASGAVPDTPQGG